MRAYTVSPVVSTRWRVISLLVTAAALVYLTREVRAFHIDVPFWDEWLLLPLIDLQARGQLTLAALLAPHNEHIPFFPRLVLLALAVPSGWNLWYECVANIVLGTATLVGGWLLIRRGTSSDPFVRHVLYLTAAGVLLSLNQWENWMWGWQLEVFLNAAAMVWALVLQSGKPGDAALVGAAACGLVATFSFGNGLLFWPATLPLVWWTWRTRPARLACWCVAAIAASGLYLSRLDLATVGAAGTSGGVLSVITITLRTLGAALSARAGISALLGATGIVVAALVVLVRWRRNAMRLDTLVWSTLLLYGAGTALLVAVGRSLGEHDPIPPRYLTFSNLFWLGLVALADVRRWTRVVAAVLVVVATTGAGLQARELYADRKATLLSGRSALFGPVGNPLVSRFFWDRQVVLDLLPALRDWRLSLYDCRRQLSRADWAAAADAIATHGRRGDLVVTTTAWGAQCLTEHLAGRDPGVRVVSAEESEGRALAALEGRASAFTVTGGDVRSVEARNWVERHGYPIYRSPVGSLRLFYYPDRTAWVTDRLTAAEVAGDAEALATDRDLVTRAEERFLLYGWSHQGTDEGGAFRAMLDSRGRLYVPVARQAPRRLRLAATLAPALQALGPGNALIISVNGVAVGEYPLADPPVELDLDIAGAAWRHGGNVLQFELRRVPAGPLNRDDLPLLIARHLVID